MPGPELPNETIGELARQAATWLPRLLLAAAILLAGLLVAWMLRLLAGKVFGAWSRWLAPRLSRLAGSGEVRARVEATSASPTVTKAAETVVFWVVFLIFTAMAAEALGLNIVSVWLAGIVGFLPRILAGLLVLLLGILIGSAVSTGVTAAATSAGFAYPRVLGRSANIAVLVVAGVVALDQVGLDVSFVIVLAAVVAAAMLGGAALAFGLGAKTSVSNILASHYLVDTFKVGHRIRIGEIEGRILEITPTSVIVEAGHERTVIPASKFSEQVATLLSS